MIKHLVQSRRYFDNCTLSEVHDDKGNLVCRLVELPYLNNESEISCVPEGRYTLSPHVSPRHGDCFILECDTLGVYKHDNDRCIRWGILWHIANVPSELKGCAATGIHFATIKGEWGVASSATAMHKLRELIKKPIQLYIKKH